MKIRSMSGLLPSFAEVVQASSPESWKIGFSDLDSGGNGLEIYEDEKSRKCYCGVYFRGQLVELEEVPPPEDAENGLGGGDEPTPSLDEILPTLLLDLTLNDSV